MIKQELIKELKKLVDTGDTEAQHERADSLLLEFINDREIKEAYDDIHRQERIITPLPTPRRKERVSMLGSKKK